MYKRQTYTRPENFITSSGLGTMGFGLPAAVGAQVARDVYKRQGLLLVREDRSGRITGVRVVMPMALPGS